jgi:hypothetical protein
MVRPKQPEITQSDRVAISNRARSVAELRAAAEIASANLAADPSFAKVKLGDEHLEMLLLRLCAGDTVRGVCNEMGIEPGLVYQRSYGDDEFKARMIGALMAGQLARIDALAGIHLDPNLDANQRRLASENWRWLASRAESVHSGSYPAAVK